MLNYIWSGMILIGVIFAAFAGNLSAVSSQVFDSAKEAVTLSLTMLSVMAFWCGILEIAKEAGIVNGLTKCIRPFVRWLYPDLPPNHPAEEAISLNMIANCLGLGNAATPAGLQAMRELVALEKERGTMPGRAGNEMCTFLVMNSASLQLISVNMIAYRSQYGSVMPTRIVGPAFAATLASAIAAVLFCKICARKSPVKRGKIKVDLFDKGR